MKIKIIIGAFLCFIFLTKTKAQDLGDFNPTNGKYGLKKLKKNSKRIYIANFNVNLQVYKDAQETKAGDKNYRKGIVKGKAKAVAAVGLNGLDEKMVQKKVNQLYNEYLEELQKNGFEIITVDEAGKTEAYEGWKKATGPSLMESKIPGVIQVIPDNYSFYYKDQSKVSKKFGINANISSAISKDLNDALVSDVQLYFLFTEDGAKDWISGNAAKVKIKVNYRLINYTTITNIKEHKSLLSIGQKTSDQVNTSSIYTQGRNKIGGSAMSTYTGSLKKDVEINGVIEKQKIVAYQKQDEDRITSFKNFALSEDRISKNVNLIEVDSNKFTEGFYNAGKKFIFYHLGELLENY
jgi:hypothetical protein